LTNAERYTTDELKHLEDVILGAEDKLYSLEYDLTYHCLSSSQLLDAFHSLYQLHPYR